MFAKRYFASRYFANRYFAKAGAAAAALTGTGDLLVIAGVLELFDDTATSTLTGPTMAPFMERAFMTGTDILFSGASQIVHLSDQGFTTNAGDEPPNTYFAPRLKEAFSIETSLFDGTEPTGGSVPAFGDVRLLNLDGGLDNLITLEWDFRSLTLYKGLLSQDFKDFTQIFDGKIDDVRLDESFITLTMRDKILPIDRTLQSSFYLGTTGLEGTSNNTGKPKPHTYGKVRNITPILIDPVKHVYQVHDRLTSAISEVRDQGVALTPAGTPDVADVFVVTPAAGEFITNLANGVFRLGTKPVGQITCDVLGDAFGSFVNTTADIVERILTERLGVANLSSSEINSTLITAFNSAQGSVVGFYTGPESVNAKDVLDALVSGAGGTWFFDRAGLFSIVQLVAPASPNFTLGLGDIVSLGAQGGIARSTPAQPSFERRVQHTRNWTVQGREDLAGAVSDVDRDFFGEPFRVSLNSSSTVTALYNDAIDVEVAGYFDVAADADTEAARLQTLYGVLRHVYQLEAINGLFTYGLNDVVTVDFGRWELSGGKDLRVIAVIENALTNKTVLVLWG